VRYAQAYFNLRKSCRPSPPHFLLPLSPPSGERAGERGNGSTLPVGLYSFLHHAQIIAIARSRHRLEAPANITMIEDKNRKTKSKSGERLTVEPAI